MKNSLLRVLVGLLLSPLANAQVTTTPVFFTDTDSVTIIYNATQGTSALQGASSVYMHSGVITSGPTGTGWNYVIGNWGQADGVGEMEPVPGETNQWQITILPRDYYGVPDGTTIYRLGMVFREGGPCSSCAEGKSDSNGDIYVDLHDGTLTYLQLTPTSSPVVVDPGEAVTFEGVFSEAVDFSFDPGNGDGATIGSAITDFGPVAVTYATAGSYQATLSYNNGGDNLTETTTVLVRGQAPTASLPAGAQKGINYNTDGTVTLVLWAPLKSNAYVLGDFNNWEISEAGQMFRDEAEEVFWITLDGLTPNVEYAYQYLVDESIRIADPYADKILDPDDQWIPASIYPDLMDYPAGAESSTWYYNRASVLEIDRVDYVWQTEGYERPAKEKLIIYELLVRDFLGQDVGSYDALIDTLDYISGLGVNAIELMPIMEFNGNDSWGYNPTFMFAVDKYYGTRNGLKAFIDECHARGIAVILDMVMNQNDIPAPFLSMYWDGAATDENPWFNRQARHPFNVFMDINHESTYTQEWLDDINRYWLEEYQFDGYRFDLSKGFTQTQYGDDVGAWSSYDAGRVAILKRMADEIWATDPNAYVILEHFASNNEETELANYGMMLWGNVHWDYKDALIGTAPNKSFSWAYAGTRGWNDLHLVSFMESHDEQRLMYEMNNFGEADGLYDIRDEATAIDRMKLAAAFLFPIPGPKMIWQFGEFGYDIDIDFNGRTGRKPTLWEYLDTDYKQELYDVHKTLFDLKLSQESWTTGTYTETTNSAFKTWTITDGSVSFHAIGNFGLDGIQQVPNFPQLGIWYDIFTGDTIYVDLAERRVTLEPGEFHILSTEPLQADRLDLTMQESLLDFYPTPDEVLGLEEVSFTDQWSLYPNPTNGSITLKAHFPVQDGVRIEIFDIFGARKGAYANVLVPQNGQFSLDVEGLTPGMYVIRIQQGQTTSATRFLKN